MNLIHTYKTPQSCARCGKKNLLGGSGWTKNHLTYFKGQYYCGECFGLNKQKKNHIKEKVKE